MNTRRFRISITGQVQGVGFRPHVWICAHKEALTGFVRNDSSGVTIEVEGSAGALQRFQICLRDELPPLAAIDSINLIEIEPIGDIGFSILESSVIASTSTPIAPDVSICDQCLREMNHPEDRRFRYPFINCTNCGPRFTIVRDIPYDRPQTTMQSFAMCSECQAEYDDPSNRRFHAQPNACPECGPQVWFVKDSKSISDQLPAQAIQAEDALAAFSAEINKGRIIATKGVGGFHLVCDAHRLDAVALLRERKGRGDKPFAMMVKDVETARAFADVDAWEERLVQSVQRPIVLLHKNSQGRFKELLESIAPGNNLVGVMLPYSPLHYLLMDRHDALVMTSGNVADEPIVRTNKEAAERLERLADSFLLHNRDIHSVCDDSVVRCLGERLLPIRRSRGYAPMPIRLREDGPSVLAVGGEIKATFCVTKGKYAYLSQHIGDVENLETLEALRRNVEHFMRLYRVAPVAIACDAHPDYLSSRWARQLAQERGVPLVTVQHHTAHAMSLSGECADSDSSSCLMCCLDGTGYGDDRKVWGGEFLMAQAERCQRWAHLEYFPLPGGDASIKRPYRVALGLLQHLGLTWDESIPAVAACPSSERRVLQHQLQRGFNCVSTSSFGRLFDAVASMIGVRQIVEYEAQAAMEMEALASQVIDQVQRTPYSFSISAGTPIQIHLRPVVEHICIEIRKQVPTNVIAAQFHRAVAELIENLAIRARSTHQIRQVGLTGGVFQNVLLAELVTDRLSASGFEVLSHAKVPPNDGGLALGQALFARQWLQDQSS